MTLLEKIVFGVFGGVLIKTISAAKESAEEERRRKNTPCYFNDGISKEQFDVIVKRASKHIKRLTKLTVDGAIVHGTVRTQSGLSEWNFEIDFNDYGHITGRYWISSDNSDSNIPSHIADNITKMIHLFPEGFGNISSSKYTNHSKSEDDEKQERIRLEKTKQQIQSFKKVKKCSFLKKHWKGLVFSIITLFCTCICISVLGYKYYESQKNIEIGVSSASVIGSNYEQVIGELKSRGFTNIVTYPVSDLELEDAELEYTVEGINIHGKDIFESYFEYPYDTRIEITYHVVKNVFIPVSAKAAKKMLFNELEALIREAGFVNINFQVEYDLITGWITEDGLIKSVTINGEDDFEENSEYRPDAEIVITYHTLKKINQSEAYHVVKIITYKFYYNTKNRVYFMK